MTKFTTRCLVMTAGLAIAAAASAAPFGQGSLVVYQIGADGATAALTNAGNAVFFKEIRISDGQLLQSIAAPTVVNGNNKRFVQSGTATSSGQLTRSTDSRFLVAGGLDADVGTAGVTASTAAAVNRVVARIDCQGVVDTTTNLTDAYDGDNFRSVASVDGSGFWMAGTATAAGVTTAGVRYVGFGPGNASTQIATLPTNTRVVNIFGGNLYVATQSSPYVGLSVITGLPTTATGTTTTMLAGFPGASTNNPASPNNQSNYDFYFADANTVYVADDGGTGARGIQKWVSNAGTWSIAYVLQGGPGSVVSGGGLLFRSITGTTVAGVTTLYVTTGDTPNATAGNRLASIVDNGVDSPFTVIATAPAFTVWRGVDFAPACPVVTCYADCDSSGGLSPADFTCFLSKYRAGGTAADCDGSGGLSPADFTCFLTKYRAGCP